MRRIEARHDVVKGSAQAHRHKTLDRTRGALVPQVIEAHHRTHASVYYYATCPDDDVPLNVAELDRVVDDIFERWCARNEGRSKPEKLPVASCGKVYGSIRHLPPDMASEMATAIAGMLKQAVTNHYSRP